MIRLETLRTCLLYAALRGWKLRQYDYKTAFLNAQMKEFTIYMEQAPGFVQQGNLHLVGLLLKSLYGLHQGPRDWNSMLHQFLISLGFRRNLKDYGLYMKTVGGIDNKPLDVVFITIYVDDTVKPAK